MTLYAVIALKQASIEPLREAVESKYPGDYRQAGDTCWFIADDVFDIPEVSKKLGVKDQLSGTITDVLVVWAVIYWGSADPQLWAWLAQKLQQKSAK